VIVGYGMAVGRAASQAAHSSRATVAPVPAATGRTYVSFTSPGMFTSAKEVMFLPDFVCLFVCLFVCVLATLLKKLWMDLSEIFCECREWQKRQVVQFGG